MAGRPARRDETSERNELTSSEKPMTKRVIFAFLVLALAVASAKTYAVTLFQPAVVAGTELKAGEYQLDLKVTRAVIKHGRLKVECDVKVETADSKFATTTVRFANGNGKLRIQEIRLGGTNLKLVFN
jgi:hypothetical protein